MKTKHERISHDKEFFTKWKFEQMRKASLELKYSKDVLSGYVEMNAQYQVKLIRSDIKALEFRLEWISEMKNIDNWQTMPLSVWAKEKIGLID